MLTLNCSAILFDLDGVLVDSTGSVDRQWRAWAREHGIDEQKVIDVAHGVRTIEVIRRVAPHIHAETEVLRLEQREADDHDGVSLMPGAVELVGSIPEGQWGVVTSGTRLLASARLQWAGLPVPRVLVTAEDVSHGKPDPEPYLKGAQLLGAKPEDCLVIEDAPAGIQSALAGGMKVVGLTSTYGAPQLRAADAVVKKLAQVQVRKDGPGRLAVSLQDHE